MTDNEIVTCTLENPSAFSEIVARYEAKLMRYIRRLGVIVAEDQEDLLQEIFIKVYKNANAFDTSLSFSSWIYRIAHNETISFYRRLRVRPEGHQIADSEEILGWLAAESVSAEGLFAANTNAEVITKALATLEPKYREPLVLRYFEHKEYDEISDILQIPVGSVGTLIHRGKKRLQTQMKSDYISI
jgi:RNA polymerase sigma-70 factor (ECF subfamily)